MDEFTIDLVCTLTNLMGSKVPKVKLGRDESDDDEEICTPPQKRAGYQLVH